MSEISRNGSAVRELLLPLSGRIADIIVGTALLVAVLVMVAPIAPWVMDLLLGFNLGSAVLLVSLSLMLKRPLSFGVLPTLLLVSTLLRLGLNVASTRLILTRADAGRIIGGFGSVVVGGDILVGLVIFCIVALVLFLVITKGAERVAEVAARFSLDALPGLQAAIDAEVRGGAISAYEAGQKRVELERQSRYFGSLDGAMKFVRGDAVATMIILAINLVGGLAVGTLRRGLGLGESLAVYGTLTVGDGLVSLLPALLTSTAAGLLVTRVGQPDDGLRPGAQLHQSLAAEPKALLVAGALLVSLAALPGLPAWPFLIFGGASLGGFIYSYREGKKTGETVCPGTVAVVRVGSQIALGCDTSRLSRLVAQEARRRMGPLLEEHQIAVIVSKEMPPGELSLDLWGQCVARVRFEPVDERLCLCRGPALRRLGIGEERRVGSGFLISQADAAIAKAGGLEILQGDALVAEMVVTWLREEAAQISTVEATARIVEELAKTSPRLVREVVPRRIGFPALGRLFGELAEEGIGVQYANRILEAIAAEPGELETDLVSRVRPRLKGIITAMHRNTSGAVETLSLGPQTESVLFSSLKRIAPEDRLALSPELAQALCHAIEEACGEAELPVLLVPVPLRRPLRNVLHHSGSAVRVLAHGELEPSAKVKHLGTVEL